MVANGIMSLTLVPTAPDTGERLNCMRPADNQTLTELAGGTPMPMSGTYAFNGSTLSITAMLMGNAQTLTFTRR